MVITHEKWGAWAMGKNGHTPNFEFCGSAYSAENDAIASQDDVSNITMEALKLTRDRICGSTTVGVANGHRAGRLFGGGIWKPSHGRCVKYRQEGQSPRHPRTLRQRLHTAAADGGWADGGTMERPLACAPGLVCTGPGFGVLPSTCVKERPQDVCFAGPWWDSSRCPCTTMKVPGMSREWALESLRTAFLVFPSEVASAMSCKYWTGPMSRFAAEVRKVTHNIFRALWPSHLVGEYPTLEELYNSIWSDTKVDLAALDAAKRKVGEDKDGRIADALALAGSWTQRPNLLWSLIHFVMHNQPSPMSRNAVAASSALASHLSENFWCNDCRGFFTVGVLSVALKI